MVMVIGPVLTVTASQFRFTAYYAVILDYCDDPEPIVTVTQTVRYNLDRGGVGLRWSNGSWHPGCWKKRYQPAPPLGAVP